MALLGVLGMCSELGWGVSCDIADVRTMSVVCTCWSVLAHNDCVLHIWDSFGVYYVFMHELV